MGQAALSRTCTWARTQGLLAQLASTLGQVVEDLRQAKENPEIGKTQPFDKLVSQSRDRLFFLSHCTDPVQECM